MSMKVFKLTGRDGKLSNCWYGKVRHGPGEHKRVKLLTYKQASEKKLADLQRTADMRASGLITADQERLELPIRQLADQYHDALAAQRKVTEHIRISRWMIGRLVEVGQWERFGDISADAVQRLLPILAQTASYQNKYIMRIKAFVHWALPDGQADPLRKLKRVSEKGAKRTRGRRAATDQEAAAFIGLWPTLPADRHLSYALAMYNGLRRGGIAELTWGQVHLDAPIPFIGQSQKMGEESDYIPIHPYVLDLLRNRTPAMPNVRFVGAVPDMKTVAKDLRRAGVKLTNAAGLRLDFHALRHTFETKLDHTGCSRATKKRLMRHAGEDVTDGYAHAELAEMLAALKRVDYTTTRRDMKMTATGTDGRADHRLDQVERFLGQRTAIEGNKAGYSLTACQADDPPYNSPAGNGLHAPAMADIENEHNPLNANNLGPSTQAD